MKTAALMSGGRNIVAYPTHPGVSQYAALIRNEFDEFKQNFARTISFGYHLSQTIEDLLQIKEEYSKDNWDGYGAKAIDNQSFNNSLLFALSMPTDIPAPEIDVVPSGQVVFIWSKGKRSVFSVIIGNRSELYHAGLYGIARVHGVEYFNDSIPETILTNISRIYSQE